MAYKPGYFYIGVIDFFGILIPGAILSFLHGEYMLAQLNAQNMLADNAPVRWVAFFVGSYLLGNLLLGLSVPLNKTLSVFRPEGRDDFYKAVKKRITLLPKVPKNRTNAFYQAYAFIRVNSVPALAEIERQMADYKLFRSLTLLCLLDFPLAWASGTLDLQRAVVVGVILILAGWRFLFLIHWTYRISFEYYAILSGRTRRTAVGKK